MSGSIRVLVVDDHSILRAALVTAIRLNPDLVLTGEASTAAQALELCHEERPDVILLDARLPDLSGIAATTKLRTEFPGMKIIVVAKYEAVGELGPALQAGARGFLLKDTLATDLIPAIRSVASGGFFVPSEAASAGGAPAPRRVPPGCPPA
jgi:DNA-binding NarL/FixJ family response regulator